MRFAHRFGLRVLTFGQLLDRDGQPLQIPQGRLAEGLGTALLLTALIGFWRMGIA